MIPREQWTRKIEDKNKPKSEWKKVMTQAELMNEIKEELENFPGMVFAISQPIEQRVNEMTTGARADLSVKIYGDDLDLLTAKAAEVERVLRSIPGCADASPDQVAGQPVLQIKVRPDQLARYGVPARQADGIHRPDLVLVGGAQVRDRPGEPGLRVAQSEDVGQVQGEPGPRGL